MNSGDVSEDEAGRLRREKDAERKRISRAERRHQREKAYMDAQRMQSNVQQIPLRVPIGVRLDQHVEIASAMVRLACGDQTISIAERAKIAIAILMPLARACEVREIGAKVEEIERALKIGAHAPTRLA